MWAYIESGNVHTVYRDPKPFTLNSISYPVGVFTLWSDSQREAISIFPVTAATKKDEAYYTLGNPSYSWNSGAKRVTETYSSSARTLSTVKTEQTTAMKDKAHGLIREYRGVVERKVYADTAIPNAVTTYVAAIRSNCATICTNIANAANVDAVKSAVDNGTWASNTDAVAYRRIEL